MIGGEYPSRTYSTNHLQIEGHRLHSTLFFLFLLPIHAFYPSVQQSISICRWTPASHHIATWDSTWLYPRVGANVSLLQVLEWKSILFQSVYLRFIPIDYEWMRNLFPTHGLIRSESPNDSVRLRLILFQSKLMSQVYSEWFRTNQNQIRIPFESVYKGKVILNDTAPFPVLSEWFRRAFKRTGFRMIRKQISHSHTGITQNHFHSEWVRNLHQVWRRIRHLLIKRNRVSNELGMSTKRWSICCIAVFLLNDSSRSSVFPLLVIRSKINGYISAW